MHRDPNFIKKRPTADKANLLFHRLRPKFPFLPVLREFSRIPYGSLAMGTNASRNCEHVEGDVTAERPNENMNKMDCALYEKNYHNH